MSTATTQQPVTTLAKFRDGLLTRYYDDVKGRLPAGVHFEQWAGGICGIFEAQPDLLKCAPQSLLSAVYEAATTGLEPGQDLFYFVPRSGVLKCDLGYKGLIALAKRNGQLKDMYARTVFGDDIFTYYQGGNENIEHQPSDDPQREQGAVRYVYAVATLPCDTKAFECLSKAQLDQHVKDHVKGGWRADSWQQMAQKTVIKRFFNSGRIPYLA